MTSRPLNRFSLVVWVQADRGKQPRIAGNCRNQTVDNPTSLFQAIRKDPAKLKPWKIRHASVKPLSQTQNPAESGNDFHE
jgi:hypothetical protein